MKDFRNYIIPALILIILFLWFSNGQSRREFRKADKVIKDSILTLKRDYEKLEIEDRNKAVLIEKLTGEKKALQIASERSRAEKVKVFTKIKIVVPDSILKAYEVVKERLDQDSVRISSLEFYAADLEVELFKGNQIISEQERALKVKDAMIEAKDLIITQTDARFENQKELTKEERKRKNKWKGIAIGAGIGILAILATK